MLKKISEVMPSMITGDGIFSNIDNPMWGDLFNSSTLDIYFVTHYGDKWCSKFPFFYVDSDTETIVSKKSQFANAIYELRATEWSHLLADLMSEYSPVENTDAYETRTITESGSGTDGNTRTLGNTTTRTLNTSKGLTGSDSGSADSTITNTGTDSSTGSTSGAGNVFGFDSVDAVGHDSNSGTSTGSTTSSSTTGSHATTSNQNSSTETETGTVTDANTGTIADSGSNSYSKSITDTYHKHGNIGTMTASQLIGGDVELWQWMFIKTICEDICDIIALSVY